MQPIRSKIPGTDPARLRAGLVLLTLAAAPGLTPAQAVAQPGNTPIASADSIPRHHAAESEFRLLFTPRYLQRLLHSRQNLNQTAGLELEIPPDALAASYAERYRIPTLLAGQIIEAAREEGIDPELGFRLIRVESVFKPNARGPQGALGLTQLMPSTARAVDRSLRTEAEILEPRANLRTGFRYLRRMIDRYDGDVRLGLLAYNRGSNNVDRALRAGTDPENGYSGRVLNLSGQRYTGTGLAEPR